jgi:ATP-dependent RNA helicase RhlE
MTFANLGLMPELLRALESAGYTTPTPVQTQAIPIVLAGGDLLASAQTGTGKTAAFALPIMQNLSNRKDARVRKCARVLVLVPTRELAAQVHASFAKYGAPLGLKFALIFGGVGYHPQVQAVAAGVDVLIATPGRLLDLIEQRAIDLTMVTQLVLDEADRMLDMGFLPALKRIFAMVPKQRQTLMFSATFAPEILQLTKQYMRNPQRVEVSPPNSTAVTVEHEMYKIDKSRKRDLLLHILAEDSRRQTLVFTKMKHSANRVVEFLEGYGFKTSALHGNKSQSARTKALADFKSGALTVLVATDIAARGLDIKALPAVINFDLPNVAEDYIHRIGRTGRAGHSGLAISLVESADNANLVAIERLLKQKITVRNVEALKLPAPAVRDPKTISASPTPRHAQRHGAAQRHGSAKPAAGTHSRAANPGGKPAIAGRAVAAKAGPAKAGGWRGMGSRPAGNNTKRFG